MEHLVDPAAQFLMLRCPKPEILPCDVAGQGNEACRILQPAAAVGDKTAGADSEFLGVLRADQEVAARLRPALKEFRDEVVGEEAGCSRDQDCATDLGRSPRSADPCVRHVSVSIAR